MTMSDNDNKKSHNGRIALLLFSLPFALVGLGTLVLAVIPNLYDWARMQSWQPVEATLLSADIKYGDADGTTTYNVVASYNYLYNGQRYQGSRIGISEKGDNIGDWQQRTFGEIQKMRPLRVWVNPNNPSESIYDRNLRWEKLGFYMIFVLLFGGFGGGMGWFALRKAEEIDDSVPLWQGTTAWRDNQIRSSAKASLWVMWGFAFFWNLLSLPILFIFPKEWAKGNHLIAIGLLFPLIGLWLIIHAINKRREWRHFGPALLRLDPFPGSIGGDVGGTIDISRRLPSDAVIEVVLSCVHVNERRSGSDRETDRTIVWQDRQSVHSEPRAKGSVIKFCFAVPEALPLSSKMELPSYHEWRVELQCKLPGIDLERDYTIPVFPAATPQRSTIHPRLANSTSHNPIPERLLHIERSGNTLRLHAPLLRHWGTALMLMAVGTLFAGIGFYFIFNEVRNGPPLFFNLIFSAVGTPVFLGGLYMLGNTFTVIATPQGIQVRRWLYGLSFSKRVASSEISSLQPAQGMQTTEGGKAIRYYSVKAHTHRGQAIKVAEGLPGASAAEYVTDLLKDVCNVAATPENFDTTTIRLGDKKFGTGDMAEEIAEKRETIRRAAKWISNIIAITMVLYFISLLLWH